MRAIQIGSIIGGLGVGALAMYLFDPKKGQSRRSMLRDKARALSNKEKEAAARILKDTRNRLKGMTHKAKRSLNKETITDLKLTERVRSAIGHAIQFNGGLEVQSQTGKVIMAGKVLASELDDLLAAIWAVDGVEALEHSLEVMESADGIPELQGTAETEKASGIGIPPAAIGMAAVGGLLALYGTFRSDRLGRTLTSVGVGMLAKGIKDVRHPQAELALQDLGWR